MTTGRLTPAAAAAIALFCAAAPVCAQVVTVIDGGYARVTYDGFLPTNAATISSAVRFENARRSLSARGTVLQFESGNRSISGAVAGNAFTPAYRNFRGEFTGAVGASTYRDFAHYGHAVARTRLHYSRSHVGTWADGALGRNYFAGERHGIQQVGTGAWLRHDLGTLSVSAMRTYAGDTTFSDAEGALRTARRYVDLDLSLGVRGFSINAGRGVYGEASATAWVWRELGVVLSGGRYPSDPARGSISGRYAALSIRFGSRGSATERGFPREISPRRPAATSFGRPLISGLEMRRAINGWRTFRIQAAGASHVEMMGDFTEWQPVALGRAGEDIWEVTLPVSPGLHRFNVRADGGEWTVPLGFASQSDDFGGIAGILIVQ